MLFYFLARSKIFKLFIIILSALSTLALVDLCNNWVTDALQILKLFVVFFSGGLVIGIEPVLSLRESISNAALIILIKLVGKLVLILDGVTHGVDVVLEGMLGINALLKSLVLLSELLSVLNHLLNLLWSESALIVSNRNSLSLTSSLLNGVHSEDTVLINLEGNLNLWHTSSSWWNTRKIKLT